MSNHSIILAEQDYPALNVFWTMLEIFIWILWLFLLFRVIGDIFRSADLSGWAKAVWSFFVIILPFLGILVYLIARGSKMHEREVQQAKANEDEFRNYVQQAAVPATGTADELTKLATLHDQGVLTDAEFNAQKAKVLT